MKKKKDDAYDDNDEADDNVQNMNQKKMKMKRKGRKNLCINQFLIYYASFVRVQNSFKSFSPH